MKEFLNGKIVDTNYENKSFPFKKFKLEDFLKNAKLAQLAQPMRSAQSIQSIKKPGFEEMLKNFRKIIEEKKITEEKNNNTEA